ncbi:SMI1/KNR4 family protein [Sphaerisporangium rhizosphaerae]|uniref:Knr4/Smi1-like domain-containing protein n=1 Tax=Sphaerisporangium rhizosphaerae TaxID=2269375 RepID=A0ABW2P6T6_9ACTN
MRQLITRGVVRRALAVAAAGAALAMAAYALRILTRRPTAPHPLTPRRDAFPAPRPGALCEPALARRPGALAGPVPRPGAPRALRAGVPLVPLDERGPERTVVRRRGRRVAPVAVLCLAVVTAALLGARAIRDTPAPAAATAPSQLASQPAPSLGAVAGTASPEVIASPEVTAGPATPVGGTCPPEGHRVLARPLDPRVRAAVDRQWRRVERWLRANAPVTYAALRPAARARAIAVAEAQTGLRFPAGLRASLLRHDGSSAGGAVLPGLRDLGVREIRDTWRALCAGRGPADWPAGRWDGRSIPFAVPAPGVAGASAVIVPGRGDVGRPSAEGVTRDPRNGWTSSYALLRATAGALEAGRPVRGLRPVVSGGRLRWAPSGSSS